MDYLSQYKSLIRKAKREHQQRILNKISGQYYEIHHIIEKCIMLIRKPQCKISQQSKYNLMNQKWNLVLLTPKEHFIAHRLIYKICQKYYGDNHPYTIKSLYAVLKFTKNKNIDYKITSRTFEYLKIEFSISMKENHSRGMLGKIMPNRKKVFCDGIIYDSIKDAIIALNMSHSGIIWRIKSKSKRFENIYFV